MLKIACFFLVIATTTPVWSQVAPAANGGGFDLDDTRMMTPPPVSGDAYPVVVGAESRVNYFDGGLVLNSSYVDNLMFGETTKAVSDEIYYFVPSVSLDRRTPRQGETLYYSPGFTLYQNTSQLNGVSQDASADYRFHVSPYAVIEISDKFAQNYNLYNQSNPFASGGVSGTPGPSNTVLIAPFANEIVNSSNAGVDYQYGRNAMVGGRGSYDFLHYSDDSHTAGLNNGNTTSAMGFFSRRIGQSEYAGVAYQFAKFSTHPIDTYTVTHTVFGFYTHYFTKSFSFSILGGPEHYAARDSDVPKRESWTPAVQGSLGWQALRTTLSASYSHEVSGAPGFGGAYHANMTSMDGRFLFSRTWSVGIEGYYSLLDGLTPALFPGGHTISAGTDVQHRVTPGFYAAIGYEHFHESYSAIPATSFVPDSNRVYLSISYGFHRPLGR